MKPFLFIFSIILVQLTYAQNSILDFATSHMGKKVGTGLCMEFVEQAENTKYKNWNDDYYLHPDSMRAHQVVPDSVKSGDLIIFDNIVFSDSSKIESHIGIICRKWGNNISYVSQNIGSHKDIENKIIYHGQEMTVFKKSKVKWALFDINNIISGDIYFFHF